MTPESLAGLLWDRLKPLILQGTPFAGLEGGEHCGFPKSMAGAWQKEIATTRSESGSSGCCVQHTGLRTTSNVEAVLAILLPEECVAT